ncbi:nucleotidyltransferase domain-containing protein [Neisseria sp. HMSC069H12]|uniref:nucleotidyltransferase domain-containing protein n=1 Tax=Neisseria sp. HMSC069H12 TaxID=1739376 RepID=UPI0008A4F64E|nr:nucleotidyltransferase domain-containing protein [Neisseria sp. HMSC069H12]OFR68435.1 hypothetical protein HMPREF2872_02550 [Neisseria sp. HMSC069H12]
MHIYAFGSICRGEYSQNSDIDILICINKDEYHEFSPEKFSIYHYERIAELWKEGNPFAWHLHLESKLIYSSNNIDFINTLGIPNSYRNIIIDFEKFKNLYIESKNDFMKGKNIVFNLSCIFLALRNISTCYSLVCKKPIFSRHSPLLIDNPIRIDESIFYILENARILSTRGIGEKINQDMTLKVKENIKYLDIWMIDMERLCYAI